MLWGKMNISSHSFLWVMIHSHTSGMWMGATALQSTPATTSKEFTESCSHTTAFIDQNLKHLIHRIIVLLIKYSVCIMQKKTVLKSSNQRSCSVAQIRISISNCFTFVYVTIEELGITSLSIPQAWFVIINGLHSRSRLYSYFLPRNLCCVNTSATFKPSHPSIITDMSAVSTWLARGLISLSQ